MGSVGGSGGGEEEEEGLGMYRVVVLKAEEKTVRTSLWIPVRASLDSMGCWNAQVR